MAHPFTFGVGLVFQGDEVFYGVFEGRRSTVWCRSLLKEHATRVGLEPPLALSGDGRPPAALRGQGTADFGRGHRRTAS